MIGIRRLSSEYAERYHLYSNSSSSGHFPSRQFVLTNVCGAFGMARYWAADCIIRRPVSFVMGMGSCLKTTDQEMRASRKRTICFLMPNDISWRGLRRRRPEVIVAGCGPLAALASYPRIYAAARVGAPAASSP